MSSIHRKGPKIDELARELGVKPRVLLDAARELGIAAQNRLTRVAAGDAERIRAHWAGAQATGEAEDRTGPAE